MKLAFFGDRHIAARSPRYHHALACWDAAIADAIEQRAEVFIGLGDVCEGDPNGEERMTLGTRYRRMTEHGAVYEVLGNHESRDALRWLEFVGVGVAWDTFVAVDVGTCRLLLSPYARKGHAPYDAIRAETIEAGHAASSERLAAAIRSALAEEKHVPLIVAGHWTVNGMLVGEHDYEIHGSTEMVVPRDAFNGTTLAITGHVHKAQALADEGAVPNIVCAGSLYRCSFAEALDPKSYVLVTVDHRSVSWERRPVPAREQIVKSITWDAITRQQIADADPLFFGLSCAGKEVKLAVEIPEDQLASFDPAVFDPIKESAALFVLERVTISAERTRAPEIALASTLGEQLGVWFAATELTVDEARQARLVEKLAEIHK